VRRVQKIKGLQKMAIHHTWHKWCQIWK
jgi:hypothetical protein